MAVGDCQIVFDFECLGYGWSETWYANSAQPSLKAFYTATVQDMGAKRAAMLAAEARLPAISVSTVSDKGDSYLRYEPFVGNANMHCDSPHTTVYTILRAQNDKYRKAVFSRGQPDDVSMNGGVFQPGNQIYVAAGTTFYDAIVQKGWGWMRSVQAAQTKITDYVVNVNDGRLHLTTGGNIFPAVAPGDPPLFRRVRILFKGLASVLNGVQTVEVIATNQCALLKPIATFPYAVAGFLTLYGTPALQPAENWNFQKVGRRACGRPKLHTPGRRRVRARG